MSNRALGIGLLNIAKNGIFARRRLAALVGISLALTACHAPEPYRVATPSRPAPTPVQPIPPSVQTQPGTPPAPIAPAEPLPAPVVREHKLSPATQALVSQAQKQTANGNYPVAAASLERALRIEPSNPQLWVELGKVRKAEGNFPQAENMARKALTMASGDNKSQSAAWQLIADSYRARGKNQEAVEAQKRAETSLR
jgi:hypothetical protein